MQSKQSAATQKQIAARVAAYGKRLKEDPARYEEEHLKAIERTRKNRAKPKTEEQKASEQQL